MGSQKNYISTCSSDHWSLATELLDLGMTDCNRSKVLTIVGQTQRGTTAVNIGVFLVSDQF